MEFTEGATGNKYIDVRLALLSAGLEKEIPSRQHHLIQQQKMGKLLEITN